MKRRPLMWCLSASALLVFTGLAELGISATVQTATRAGEGLATPAEHRRTPDQTFLTFPEWYLVHSPAEYAAYLSSNAPPSAFPLFTHIAQFWSAYAAVNHEIDKYPFNGGYHVMVMVIGTSTTVEYGLKSIYEHTVGRLAEATVSGSGAVPEERFAAKYAQDYVDFIRVEPWYKFDFWHVLRALWSEAPVAGGNLLRRWERRFALSTELLVKEGYARLIKLGTQSMYEAPKPVTAVILSRSPVTGLPEHPDFTVLSVRNDAVLATVPRYEAFTSYARWLAAQHIDFEEIAGNDGEVLVSLLAPTTWHAKADTRLLFEQPVLTTPGRKRVVVAVGVPRVAAVLRTLDAQPDLSIEHIYDF